MWKRRSRAQTALGKLESYMQSMRLDHKLAATQQSTGNGLKTWTWDLRNHKTPRGKHTRAATFLTSVLVIFFWICSTGKGNESKIKWDSVSPVQFSRSVVSDSLRPHESQHARPPCPSPTPRVYSDSCSSSRWCHPAISSSVVPFSSCPQPLPASGSFPMSQLFAWGSQSIGASASTSVLPMNTQDWSPLGWTGWLSLQFKGLSRVFSKTIVQKHQFFSAQLSL